MLRVYYGSLPDEIYNTSVYFDNTYQDSWLSDPFVQEMIRGVDHSEVLTANVIQNDIMGAFPPTGLSGGVKTLILMYKKPTGIYNASTCGDNCASYILEIAKRRAETNKSKKDLTICLHHLMVFGKDFQIRVINDHRRKIIKNPEELLLLGNRYLHENAGKNERDFYMIDTGLIKESKDETMKTSLTGCTIYGGGHLAMVLAGAFRDGFLPGYQLDTCISRKEEDAIKVKEEAGEAGIGASAGDKEWFMSHKTDSKFLLEAASVEAVMEITIEALKRGMNVVPLSIGAFADDKFRKEVEGTILDLRSKYGDAAPHVYIPSGAVGGFDALQTITLMAQAKKQAIRTGLWNHKNEKALRNTPVYRDGLTEAKEDVDVFDGTADDAIKVLPTKVNVAVATSLAGIGPAQSFTKITATPGFVGDSQCAIAETDGYSANVDIYSKDADIAAWSIVALLRNLQSPIMMY